MFDENIKLLPTGYHVTAARIPFGFVDSYGYLWHGHALRFFEDGRADTVRGRGLTAKDFRELQLAVPMVNTQTNYHSPAYDDELIHIHTSLKKPELPLPRLYFDYRITRASDNTLLISGQTKQVMVKVEGNRIIVRTPGVVLDRLENLWHYLSTACLSTVCKDTHSLAVGE
ncbi:MAG TPA: thioesterase family protein [Spongiibacteraceae bacterium]|jgi:acyl-CoA thioester hydrolase